MPVHRLLVEIRSEEQIWYLNRGNILKVRTDYWINIWKGKRKKIHHVSATQKQKLQKNDENHQLQFKNILLYYNILWYLNCYSGSQLRIQHIQHFFFFSFPWDLHPHTDLSDAIRFGAIVVHCRRLLLCFLVVLWLWTWCRLRGVY